MVTMKSELVGYGRKRLWPSLKCRNNFFGGPEKNTRNQSHFQTPGPYSKENFHLVSRLKMCGVVPSISCPSSRCNT
jgi:hypothetical protein